MKTLLDIIKESINSNDEERYWKKYFAGNNRNNITMMNNGIKKYICCYYLKDEVKSRMKTGIYGGVLDLKNINDTITNINTDLQNIIGGNNYTEQIEYIIRNELLTTDANKTNWEQNVMPILKSMSNITWVNNYLSKII